jgi:hypothetical protein
LYKRQIKDNSHVQPFPWNFSFQILARNVCRDKQKAQDRHKISQKYFMTRKKHRTLKAIALSDHLKQEE